MGGIIPQHGRVGARRNTVKDLICRVVHAVYSNQDQAILYKRRSAWRTAASRTAARSPRKRLSCVSITTRRPSRVAKPNQTVPTGLPGTAPPGPAIPLIDTARSAPLRRNACRASSATVASLTAPWRLRVVARTPRSRRLAASEYTTQPAKNQFEAPAGSVNARASPPPVQDSAVATVRPRLSRRRTTRCSKTSIRGGVSHGRVTIGVWQIIPR